VRSSLEGVPMFPLLENVSLDADQSIAATRLLLRIAHVDGARTTEEVALIRWFHDSGCDASVDWPAFDSLQEAGPGGEFSCTFGAAAERDLVVATCLMVAYADGVLTPEELAAVRDVAEEIGMPSTPSMNCWHWSRTTSCRNWPICPTPARWRSWRANSAEVLRGSKEGSADSRLHPCVRRRPACMRPQDLAGGGRRRVRNDTPRGSRADVCRFFLHLVRAIVVKKPDSLAKRLIYKVYNTRARILLKVIDVRRLFRDMTQAVLDVTLSAVKNEFLH
jgi:hypothetical protein